MNLEVPFLGNVPTYVLYIYVYVQNSSWKSSLSLVFEMIEITEYP